MTNPKARAGLTLACLSLTLGLAGSSLADDAALYEKPLDPKAAFVRVIAPGAMSAAVRSTAFSSLENGVTPYVAVEPGEIEVSSSFHETKVTAGAGKFYSAVLTETGVKAIEDTVTKNPAKANLTLYNLTDAKNVSIFVPKASADAISGVDAGLSKSVALRAPLTVDIVVRADGKDVTTIKALEFKRNSGITVILSSAGGTMNAVAVTSSIAR